MFQFLIGIGIGFYLGFSANLGEITKLRKEISTLKEKQVNSWFSRNKKSE